MPLHGEVDGYFSVKSHGDDAVAYFADRFRSTLRYTNPETGLTYTVVRVHQTKDLRITDNVDGTQTLVGLNTGAMWVYGPTALSSRGGPVVPSTPSWWTPWGRPTRSTTS